MSKLTESVVEETALGWLHGLGYAVLTERTFRHIKTGKPEVANMPPNRSFQWTVKELRSLPSAEFERLGHNTRRSNGCANSSSDR